MTPAKFKLLYQLSAFDPPSERTIRLDEVLLLESTTAVALTRLSVTRYSVHPARGTPVLETVDFGNNGHPASHSARHLNNTSVFIS
ncbi:uncharacterized protein ARMOST_04535 [Armillaria ostoyae]|uniref:Uncharacterized protein n=1 Tax=Armillaria ostoyae TaxID=47428 RepID=A0A284QXL4_ARMOS|nr:uncharacterized protein ARMOST_04535 [Armillaria ostoyae]